MVSLLFLVVALFLGSAPAWGSEPEHQPEGFQKYQLRASLHGQKFWRESFGIAGWGVVRTGQHDTQGLVLGGVVYGNRHSWAELLGGSLFEAEGESPALEVRGQKVLGRLESRLEAGYFFGKKELRLIPEATVALCPFGEGALRLGVEAEIEVRSGSTDYSLGPRLALPLWVHEVEVGGTYQLGPEKDFLLIDLLVHF